MEFREIYERGASDYDLLVHFEDADGALWDALDEVVDWHDTTVAELGAGTGRLTSALATRCQQVHAFDRAPTMLEIARRRLDEDGVTNVTLHEADHRAVPLPDHDVDVVVEGWSFSHFIDFEPDQWEQSLDAAIGECVRLVAPGGTVILIETLGTGTTEPTPPTDEHARLYERLEQQHGFDRRVVRTDYRFPDVPTAERLVIGFFGPEMATRLTGPDGTTLHEVTGIWTRKYRPDE